MTFTSRTPYGQVAVSSGRRYSRAFQLVSISARLLRRLVSRSSRSLAKSVEPDLSIGGASCAAGRGPNRRSCLADKRGPEMLTS